MLIASVDLEQESLMQTALIHQPIVAAIRSGDIEAAAVTMERHIRATWADVLKVYGADAPKPPGEGLSGRVRRKTARRLEHDGRAKELAE